MNLPCSNQGLMPQTGKMGFAQLLRRAKLTDCESTAEIGAEHLFINDQQQLSNSALIEYLNQLIASVRGYDAIINHKIVQKGLFVGVQEAEFFQPVYCGDLITLKGQITDEISQVSFVRGVVQKGGESVATFVSKLYDVQDETEFERLTQFQHPAALPAAFDVLPQCLPPRFLDSLLQRKIYSYFQVLQRDPNQLSFRIACPDDFEAFNGHFEDKPILPGIVLLEVGQVALKVLLDRSVVISNVKKMKISNVVVPNQVIVGTISITSIAHKRIVFTGTFHDQEGKEISRYNGCCKEGFSL